MRKHTGLTVGLTLLCWAALGAQTAVVTDNQSSVVVGNHDTPLRPVNGTGNVGISNAVLRDQSEIRALRVVVEPGGTRAMHAHNDVRFHLFIPITGTMQLDLDGAPSVTVEPWQPYYMKAGTRHGFHNEGRVVVEIMEVFIR